MACLTLRLFLSLLFFVTVSIRAAALDPTVKSSPTSASQEKNVKNTVHSFNLDPKGKFTIENEIGDITLESWEKNTTEVSVFKTSSVSSNFEKIKIEVDEQPNRLKLKTIFIDKLKGENSVDYVVFVPPTVDVYLKTTVGKIQVKDLTGRVTLSAEQGDFQLKNLTGAIEGKTERGIINLEFRNPITNDVSLRVDEGAIKLNLPPQLDAFLWAESEEGTVKNGLQQLQATSNQEQKSVKGQIGKGGKLIHLQASKGNIDLAPIGVIAGMEQKGLAPAIKSPVNAPIPTQPMEKKPQPLSDQPVASGKSNQAIQPGQSGQTIQSSLANPDSLTSVSKTQEPPANFRAEPASAPQDKMSAKVESGPGGDAIFKVKTNLISLNANVIDRNSGKSLINLKKGDFLVYEDNVLQNIAHFSSVETPFNVLMLLDISGSMEEKFDVLQEASIKFTRLLKPQDRIAIAVFNHQFQLVSDFTDDRTELARSILSIEPGGGTAFYDALDYSLRHLFRGIKERKGIIIFTDGADNQHMPDQYENGSRVTFPELFREIEETDITIYPIFLNTEGDPKSGVDVRGDRVQSLDDVLDDIFGVKKRKRQASPPRKRRTLAGVEVYSDLYANAIDELYKIADQTGGKIYAPSDIKDLNSIYEQIVNDLSIQFSLGYYPSNPSEDGRWKKISVKVKDMPGVAVRSRKGYYAGGTRREKSRLTDETNKGKRRVF